MNTAADILLIIVSATLAIFLVVLSIALYFLISFLKDLKRISARADSVAGAVESAAFALRKTATPVAAIKLVGTIIGKLRENKRKG